MIIDANNLILGRMATVAAKKALLGEEVEIVNCENAVIIGEKAQIVAKFQREKSKSIQKGPYMPRKPDRFVRRVIKRMLPFKNARGREAFGRINCHIGIPEELKDKKIETIKEADVSRAPTMKYINVEKICKLMGGK